MAYPKYNPNDIDMSIYPKRWLDVAPVSFEDALKQAQALQNAETVNDINQQNLEDKKRDNDYEAELGKTVQERMEQKKATGEPEMLSTEETLDIANSVGFKFGKGKEIADRELRRSEAAANRALAERRLEQPKIRTTSGYSGISLVNPDTGEVTVLDEAEKRPSKEEDSKVTMANPNTGQRAELDKSDPDYSEALAMAIANGYSVKIKNAGEMSEKDFNDMREDKEIFGGKGVSKTEEIKGTDKVTEAPKRLPGESITDYRKRVGL